MANLGPALDFTFGNEGGFCIDDGGPTKYGVTQATLDRARKARPAAKYPKDVRDLTQAQAADVYRQDFLPDHFDDIASQRVATVLFDMGVNAGVSEAVTLMQRALNALGVQPRVDVDGKLGPMTLAAINAANPSALLGAFANARIAYYSYLAQKDPAKYGGYLKGWVARAKRMPPPDPAPAPPAAPPAVEA